DRIESLIPKSSSRAAKSEEGAKHAIDDLTRRMETMLESKRVVEDINSRMQPALRALQRFALVFPAGVDLNSVKEIHILSKDLDTLKDGVKVILQTKDAELIQVIDQGKLSRERWQFSFSLESIDAMSGVDFEQYVIKVLKNEGY